MEYEILGIEEGASIEEAKKSLNKIRLSNHPDKVPESERLRATTILRQAESAYKRIKEKNKVNSIFNNLLGPMSSSPFGIMNSSFLEPGFHLGPQFGSFSINDMHNLHDLTKMEGGKNIHTSTYSYQNFNGNVKESGTINGKPMTEDELKQYRKGNRLKVKKHIK